MIPKIDLQDLKRANVVYHEIKRRIIEVRYMPGDKLSEARIAVELGVGRSPIRTALSRLQNEGWIEVLPQSGTFVKGLSPTEVAEIFETRLVLEPHLAGLAAERISDEELHRLRVAFNSFGNKVNRTQAEEFLELDLMFHTAIYDAAGNGLIKRILINLIDKVRWIRRSSDRSTPRFQEALTEIKGIYRALVARDTKAAADAMHVHIKNAYKFGPAR
jgi:DNA-binding GntR family transcriptional regulator